MIRRLRHLSVAAAAHVFFAATRLVPRTLAIRLAGGLGRTWARVGGPRTRIAEENLRLAFPDWTDEQVRGTLVGCFGSLAQSAAETVWLQRGGGGDPRRWVQLGDLGPLRDARAASKHGGVFLLTAHYGSWELFAAAVVAEGIPVSVVHRENRNPYLERLILRSRERCGIEVLRRGSAGRAVYKALKQGHLVVMPLDQDTDREEGVFVRFFGRRACTRAGPAQLAMWLDVPVVPAFLYRQERGLRHVARISPALDLLAGDEHEKALRENVARMTKAIEDAIRVDPEQWTWVHRRWRTRPNRRRKRKEGAT